MPVSLDEIEKRLADGAPLRDEDVDALFEAENLIVVAALADEARRRATGDVVTFVRVAEVPVGEVGARQLQIPATAGEIRLTGRPVDFAHAFRTVAAAAAAAGGRPVSAFSLGDLEALAGGDYQWLARELARLREGGLELIADAPIDRLADAFAALGAVEQAELAVARLSVQGGTPGDSATTVRSLRAACQDRPCVRAVAPLPRTPEIAADTTGYDDVRLVAAMRLALSGERFGSLPVQVDWQIYGPKLAQVALLCGASDLDAVPAAEVEDRGPRRTASEEVRRNIRAAGLQPVERDGRFARVPSKGDPDRHADPGESGRHSASSQALGGPYAATAEMVAPAPGVVTDAPVVGAARGEASGRVAARFSDGSDVSGRVAARVAAAARPVRVSAVSYLNSRPLVYGLDRRPDRFAVQYDVPSVCAARLHEGTVDLGLIPAIEYLSRERYRIVPGVAVASRGPVASVCLFSRSPIEQVRRIALDTSSRTSAALVRILCARHFGIDPEFVPHPPDLDAMLSNSDAALLIGDLALQLNRAARERWNPENPQNPETPESRHAGTEPRNPGTQEPRNLEVLDLGEAWTSMTGLPFVWAFWVGPEGALDASHVAALQVARDCGVTSVDDVAAAFSAEPAERRRAAAYLRENIRFWLGSAELEGLRQYYRHAAELGLVAAARDPAFF